MDSDGDGIDDAWERLNFGDLSHDGSTDSDNDGETDLAEFKAGTNPADANSVFKGTAVTTLADGSATLKWASVAGKVYKVEFKDDLNEASWSTLNSAVTAAAESTEITDQNAGGSSHRYYRIQVAE